MRARVHKWGNSLAIRIPKALATEAGLERNTPIDVSFVDGKILAAPHSRPTPTLEELVAGITEENRHGEVDWGPPVGKEVW